VSVWGRAALPDAAVLRSSAGPTGGALVVGRADAGAVPTGLSPRTAPSPSQLQNDNAEGSGGEGDGRRASAKGEEHGERIDERGESGDKTRRGRNKRGEGSNESGEKRSGESGADGEDGERDERGDEGERGQGCGQRGRVQVSSLVTCTRDATRSSR
jgi:hypothetical protein